MLSGERGGVGGQEAEEGEQGLPEEGPVVRQSGAGAGEVGEDAVEETEGGLVEVAVETEAQVVRYAVDADVEEGGYGSARIRTWWEEGRNLATEADREGSGWGGEKLSGEGVFEDKAEDGEGEDPVEGTPGRTVCVVQEVGCVA